MGPSARAQTGRILLPFNIIIIFLISGCAGPSHLAPVSEVAQPPSIRLQEHVVSPGETLYSIAWRYNLNHRELAQANGIDRDATIYPGQRLSLNANQPRAMEPPPATAPAQPQAAPKAAPVTAASPPPRSENQTNPPKPRLAPAAGNDPAKWLWPARGKIVAHFESNGGLNKGIDIGGDLGEPVHASAAGNVVYSGSGLRGYGHLVIVKHSENFLSAYAHNSSLLVEEGESVTAGQKIAEIGSSGTDSVKLHFEIRRDGKPVNPLKYLPER